MQNTASAWHAALSRWDSPGEGWTTGLRRQLKTNIALTGFMAVGKSAVGRALARKLRLRFVDLDRFIEKSEGMKVREIFSRKGEGYFRQREREALEKILGRQGQVIATGGGVVVDEDNLRLLREKALLVCLTAAPQVLLERAGRSTKRPLLAGTNREERIKELLEKREKNYARAHLCVETDHLNIEQVADKIIALFKAPNHGTTP